MNITNDERRIVILRRLEGLRDRIRDAAYRYGQISGGAREHDDARAELRIELAEIADGLGEVCD